MSAHEDGPTTIALNAKGVGTSRESVFRSTVETEAEVYNAKRAGIAILRIGEPFREKDPIMSIGRGSAIELDAAACRHLAALLVAKAGELDAAAPASEVVTIGGDVQADGLVLQERGR